MSVHDTTFIDCCPSNNKFSQFFELENFQAKEQGKKTKSANQTTYDPETISSNVKHQSRGEWLYLEVLKASSSFHVVCLWWVWGSHNNTSPVFTNVLRCFVCVDFGENVDWVGGMTLSHVTILKKHDV